MSTLRWGIKASLLDYVRGRDDGSIVAGRGARDDADGFAFEGTTGDGTAGDGLRFRGTVTLTAHGGMMRVVIADPSLEEREGGWMLQIADPDDPDARLDFATVAGFDGRRGEGVALTEDGADLFFGPYRAGTPLDDPSVDP